jgi:hypothetical protein
VDAHGLRPSIPDQAGPPGPARGAPGAPAMRIPLCPRSHPGLGSGGPSPPSRPGAHPTRSPAGNGCPTPGRRGVPEPHLFSPSCLHQGDTAAHPHSPTRGTAPLLQGTGFILRSSAPTPVPAGPPGVRDWTGRASGPASPAARPV